MANYNEWDAKAGLIRPEVVQVVDGYYTQRILVKTGSLEVQVLGAETPIAYLDVDELEYEYEELPVAIPRYRHEVRWKRWDE